MRWARTRRRAAAAALRTRSCRPPSSSVSRSRPSRVRALLVSHALPCFAGPASGPCAALRPSDRCCLCSRACSVSRQQPVILMMLRSLTPGFRVRRIVLSCLSSCTGSCKRARLGSEHRACFSVCRREPSRQRGRGCRRGAVRTPSPVSSGPNSRPETAGSGTTRRRPSVSVGPGSDSQPAAKPSHRCCRS